MKETCFVIQPFDAGKFDKRFKDIYKPAIEAANLEAYRVDLNPSVKIPFEDIEDKIKNATICFAEISSDNPNVWYELGYAFALGKDVIMVCDESRKDFPFDIRHKKIIPYESESTSDFKLLETKITETIIAYLKTQQTTKRILDSPIKNIEGLQSHELSLMAFIIGEQYTDETEVSIYDIKTKMNKAGYNDTAFSIGVRQLKAKSYITTQLLTDYNGNEYPACSLSEHGIEFIINNTDFFDLKQSQKTVTPQLVAPKIVDDLPF